MTRALALSVMLAGCAVRTQGEVYTLPVAVEVDNSEGLSFSGPLWAAVVWMGDAGVETTASAPVDFPTPDAGVGTVTLQLSAPADIDQLGLKPLETLELGGGVPVYRPRLVVYENTTGQTLFQFDGEDAGAGDRVVAVDGNVSMAYVLDLDGQLQTLDASDTDSYYAATGGLYTPFAEVALDTTTGNLAFDTGGPLALTVTEGPEADADLACGRAVAQAAFTEVDLLTTPATIDVDTGLDPEQVCGTSVGACQSVWLDGVTPPATADINLDDHLRVTQCEQSGALESFLVFDAVRGCRGCSCQWTATLQVYVATSAKPPAWWPCGTPVPFCSPPGSFLALDLTCAGLTG
jgi:hypothetical protein